MSEAIVEHDVLVIVEAMQASASGDAWVALGSITATVEHRGRAAIVTASWRELVALGATPESHLIIDGRRHRITAITFGATQSSTVKIVARALGRVRCLPQSRHGAGNASHDCGCGRAGSHNCGSASAASHNHGCRRCAGPGASRCRCWVKSARATFERVLCLVEWRDPRRSILTGRERSGISHAAMVPNVQ